MTTNQTEVKLLQIDKQVAGSPALPYSTQLNTVICQLPGKSRALCLQKIHDGLL